MNYWDTSCLLKLYVRESDSDAYLALLADQTTPLFASALAEVEFAFALARKESEGCLKRGAAAALTQFLKNHAAQGKIRFLPIDAAVRNRAVALAQSRGTNGKSRLSLRTLDGIHLATALEMRAARFLTADIRLRTAARVYGLEVL